MGGYGSSRWGRYRRRPRVTDYRRLDLRDLRRAGIFDHPGERGRIEWTDKWAVGFALELGETTGELRLAWPLGDERRYRVRVALSTLAIPNGGYTWYMACPSCGRRVRVLYLIGPRWECRRCGRLTYRSAQEHDKTQDKMRRLWRSDPTAMMALLQLGDPAACMFVLSEHGKQRGY